MRTETDTQTSQVIGNGNGNGDAITRTTDGNSTAEDTAGRLPAAMPYASLSALALGRFVWGAGVECTFLPHLNVDQFAWTQHDRFWREDFRLAAEELGVSQLRYAFPWHVLEPRPGEFDFAFSDERMEQCEKLGIELILDVMHFGTPTWLKQAVGDPEFPEALERFTHALVERYGHAIRMWSPCNEPLVTALFSGDFGFWPPHARKWRGYMPVLSRIVQGVSRGIRAIRRHKPDATVLLIDTAENYRTKYESLAAEVRRRNLRRFIVMDLLTGRVDRRHPLYAWLHGYGISELDLQWFRDNPQTPDVLGLDYYANGDWQLDLINGSVSQKRADSPVGLYGVAHQYYRRYGLPMMLTETSIEGEPINRETWFDLTVDHIRRLRADGVPMLGFFWWPLIDSVDWDGACTHQVGKVHQVGLFRLSRQADGTLARNATPLVKLFREAAAAGDERVGTLETIARPIDDDQEQGPPIGEAYAEVLGEAPTPDDDARDGNGQATETSMTAFARGDGDPVPGLAAEPSVSSTRPAAEAIETPGLSDTTATDRYGIVVFSHLRWGFVWQRPQQFLSRFARKHTVLFIEEPRFDLRESEEPRLMKHRVMPNVVVSCPHFPPSYNRNPALPKLLRQFAHEAIDDLNEHGEFDQSLLWYYSPMDSAWSLGHFTNRGVVYDCMDELSQFTGAPTSLIANEARLMEYADVVFTGGYELWTKKKQQHDNVHFFGCGVEFDHFAAAQDEHTAIPPDIDFLGRPILGWFGVIDERLDYGLIGEVARARPDWSFAMVGPVVKVDPNLLPHNPNLFWLGQRDYQILPNYCRAFDICMMPFALNAATQYINPTKVLEYLATGRPVISTPVRDVVRLYDDLVHIVRNADEFIEATNRLLEHRDGQRIRQGIDRARQNSWEKTVETMRGLIHKAIGRPDRRSSRKPGPLVGAEAELLSYQYQPTPGS